MSMQSEATPFARLGNKLKSARQSIKESLAEVAGAVEIEEDDYRSIERGVSRPTEEILMLLIQHFAMQDEEAVLLWELAGYDKEQDSDVAGAVTKTIVMALSMDPRVVYSDQVQINGNKHGFDRNGKQVKRELTGFVARIAQHEIDHLDGIRFPDRIPIDKPDRLHWVEPAEFDRYRKNWMHWPITCTRARWDELKAGTTT